MANKDVRFPWNVVTYVGVFTFSEFYDFCYNWIMKEIDPNEFEEKLYSEKVVGDGKVLDVEWNFKKKFTDYFRFDGRVRFHTVAMKKVELVQDGKKIKTNQGEITVKIRGTLTKDYKNRFEESLVLRKWRAIYEKWIIASRVDNYETKLVNFCNDFMNEAKAFLELEGKK